MRHLDVNPGSTRLRVLLLLTGCAALAAGPAERAHAATLNQATRAAFEKYVKLTDQRNAEELSGGKNFLWIDSLAPEARVHAYQSLAAGKPQINPLDTLDEGKQIPCPDGLIHHWIGTVFIPGARLDQVLRILQDYNHHANYYGPDVQQARIESHEGNHFLVFLRFRRTEVITAVIDTVNSIQYFRDGPSRAHSRSSAIRVNEVANPGTRGEREKPAGRDNGFLWGMETWWRMEQKDGGVYIQSEVVSLTRGIPPGLGWLIAPFVDSIPRDSLTFTLEATRRAVLADKTQILNAASH